MVVTVRKEGCGNVSNAATAREFNLEEVNNKQDLSWIKALNNGSQDTENTTHEGLPVYNSTLSVVAWCHLNLTLGLTPRYGLSR